MTPSNFPTPGSMKQRHVMLIGSVGTGKTTLVQSFLRDHASDYLLSCTINTSYYTDAAATQKQLEQPLDKVRSILWCVGDILLWVFIVEPGVF